MATGEDRRSRDTFNLFPAPTTKRRKKEASCWRFSLLPHTKNSSSKDIMLEPSMCGPERGEGPDWEVQPLPPLSTWRFGSWDLSIFKSLRADRATMAAAAAAAEDEGPEESFELFRSLSSFRIVGVQSDRGGANRR